MATAQDIVPGLKRLTCLKTIHIDQKVSSRVKGNTYTILSEEKEVLFNLIEEPPKRYVRRGGGRGFRMDGVDNTGEKVFSIRRPGASMSEKIEVSMNGARISVVREKSSFLTPVFSINDAEDCPAYTLKGKMWAIPSNYQLLTKLKDVIGSVKKTDRGWKKELMSKEDEYVISFPVHLALHFKLALIAACILIDFKFHEYK